MSNLWWARCALSLFCFGTPLSIAAATADASIRTTIASTHGMLSQAAILSNAATSAVLSGTVSDPSGAKITHASVHVQNPTFERDTITDNTGYFSLPLPAGTYDVTIVAVGFEPYITNITLGDKAARASIDAKLVIAAKAEEITVPSDVPSTSSEDNKSALSFKGDELKTFSDNDATFQQEITSLAGGTGEGGAQIYVDGFSGGSMPPKDTILSVRINHNPFSAQYADLGLGRIEVSTKPGSNKLHGSYNAAGNDDIFNARNPYAGAQPPYYFFFNEGDISGPLGKKTSFFISGNFNDARNNAVVDAFNPNGSSLTEAVPDPQTSGTFSLRLDRQLTKNNTFTSRYEFNKIDLTNSGVGLLVLPSEGINSSTTMQTLQLGNTQLIGASIVSETHFQYIRTRADQTPVSTAPTIIVQGYFSGGGAPTQASRDNQDHYEFQEYLSIAHHNHFIRTGARYRLQRDANVSTANYNGQYIFSTLPDYQAGTPTQFSLTAGQSSAVALTGDLGAYAEDEWKVRKSVTLTYGLRIESQTAIPDRFDPAPRAEVAWAVGQTDKRQPIVVIRAHGGIFYERFLASNILTSVRQNGVSQQTYFVNNPGFYPSIPLPSELSGTPPTPYTISPHLRAAQENIGGVTVEKTIGKIGSVTANYLAVRGVHQYNSLNINAPLPGSYNPDDPTSGVRPLGGSQNIYQFASDGIEKTQTFYANGNLHPTKRLFLFAFYVARHQMSDTFGSTNFPSQPYNVSADYGPSGLSFLPVGQRLFTGGNFQLPFGFTANLFLSADSRQRFNITTGTDLNGDTIYNDRPAFATNTNANSIIYKTRYGTFDANPQPGEAIIPYNYAKGPGIFFSDLGVSKEFKFGPRIAAPAPPPGATPPKGPAPKPDRAFSLSFSVEAANVINHVNAGPPVGILNSPLFGQSNSLNPFFSFSGNSAANRVIFLQSTFHF